MKRNKTFTFYDNLKTSDNLKQRILNKTINKKETQFRRIPKLAYTISLILLVSFISCSIVFAAIYMCTTTFTKSIDENGDYHQGIVLKDPVEIKDDGTFEISQGMTLADIENALDIQFADNIDKSSIVNECDIKRNDDGKIESVEILIDDYVDYSAENSKRKGFDSNKDNYEGWLNGKHLSLYISFMTPYASSEVKEKFGNLYDAYAADVETEPIEIKLNKVNAIAYYYNPFNSRHSLLNYASFTYNNIAYFYDGYLVSKEEVIDAIE